MRGSAPTTAIGVPSFGEVEQRLSQVAFMRRFALQCVDFSDGYAGTVLEAQSHLLNPEGDGIDDAAIVSVMDQLGSVAIWSRYGLHYPHATVSMSVALLGRPGLGPVRFEGSVLSVDRGLCHTSLLAKDASSGRAVAHGRTSFLMGAYAGGKSRQGEWEAGDGPVAGTRRAQSFGDDFGASVEKGVCQLPFDAELVGSRNPDRLHGGAVLSGLILSARSVGGLPNDQVLSGISIEFLKGGTAQQTAFRAERVQSGRRASTVSISASQGDNREIAIGLARFTNFTAL